MACEARTGTGKDAILEYVIACLDKLPSDEDWKVFGAVRTKGVTNAGNTVDTTADDTKGRYGESIVTTYTKEYTIDGIIRKTGPSAQGFAEIYAHWNNPEATGDQPVMWIRFTDPTGVETAPVVITSIDKSAPTDDVMTYSMGFSVTGSEVGVVFEPAKFDKPETFSFDD